MKRIFSFKESFLFSKVLKESRRIFEEFGYRYIRLPTFDTETIVKNFICVLNTRENENLYLRSDFTSQIIKHFDSINDVFLPLKIYYEGNLFLPELEEFETYQLGIELIGVEGYVGDFEVIFCIYTLLKELNIKEFKIVLGFPIIIDEILNKFSEQRDIVKIMIEKKNLSDIRNKFGKGSLLEKLIFMQGKKEIVETAMKEFPSIKNKLEDIYTLSEKIESFLTENYIIDLSQVRKLPYYNGITFEFISNYFMFPLASGGRYDGIYYENIPATGGAIYVDNIVSIIKDYRESNIGFVILCNNISDSLINITNIFMEKSVLFSIIYKEKFEKVKKYADYTKLKYILILDELKVYDIENKNWYSFKLLNEFLDFFNIA